VNAALDPQNLRRPDAKRGEHQKTTMKRAFNAAILLISLIILSCFHCQDYVSDTFIPSQVRGKIIEKYRDRHNYAVRMLLVKQTNDTLKISFIISEEMNVWDYTQVGDSLIKNQGEDFYRVLRNHTKKEFVMNCDNMLD
jgi:uncharacterized membrane-anchored protein YitT (DUF2179 family)